MSTAKPDARPAATSPAEPRRYSQQLLLRGDFTAVHQVNIEDVTEIDKELAALEGGVAAAQEAAQQLRKAAQQVESLVGRTILAGADPSEVQRTLAPLHASLGPEGLALWPKQQPAGECDGPDPAHSERIEQVRQMLSTNPDLRGKDVAEQLGGFSPRTGQRLLKKARSGE